MKNIKSIHMKNLRMFILFLLFLPIQIESVFAEKGQANETMKTVFKEVKKDVSGNTNITSILMIVGVVAVVGLAIYLSFSGSEEKKFIRKAKK
ncbi:MAG: hypothetical protein H0V01_01180 [Bacteroidetes bacterium]|nr:hypothetical protein [Bacteroidota bacterium]HET6244782.1 hypothetical protein [Bacteroidia bacterium]